MAEKASKGMKGEWIVVILLLLSVTALSSVMLWVNFIPPSNAETVTSGESMEQQAKEESTRPKTSKEDLRLLRDSALNGYKHKATDPSKNIPSSELYKSKNPIALNSSVNSASSGDAAVMDSSVSTGGNIDDNVNFWVSKIKESAAADGKMTLPTEREIALQAQQEILGSCDDLTPCNQKTYQIRKKIMERLVDESRPQSLTDAFAYWWFKILLGDPVPTKDQVVAKGFGNPPCMQNPDKCDKEITALIKLLDIHRQDTVGNARAKYNGYNRLLKYAYQKELQGMAALKASNPDPVKLEEEFKKICPGNRTTPICTFTYNEVCNKARMKGLDCYANSQALERAARKELGIPIVGISPGDTRAPGVLEPGADLSKYPGGDFYTVPAPPDQSDAKDAFDILTEAGGGGSSTGVSIRTLAGIVQTTASSTESGSVENAKSSKEYPLFGFDAMEALNYLNANALLDSKILDAVP
eukprot:jgi/Mesvir1/26704/Mv20482-RA.1